MSFAYVDLSVCDSCQYYGYWQCIQACPHDAIRPTGYIEDDGKVAVTEYCVGCEACVGACPTGAIYMDFYFPDYPKAPTPSLVHYPDYIEGNTFDIEWTGHDF